MTAARRDPNSHGGASREAACPRVVVQLARAQDENAGGHRSLSCAHGRPERVRAVAPAISFEAGMTPKEEGYFWKCVVVVEDCWEWCGGLKGCGYGAFHCAGRSRLVHRVSYEHYIGPIPAGLTIDHLCRNRRCVKPSHLQPVTMQENTLRGFGVTGMNARKTHCPNGHPLSGDNLAPNKYRRRRCLTCERAREALRGRHLHVRTRGPVNA